MRTAQAPRLVFLSIVLGFALVALGCGKSDNNPPAPPLIQVKGKVLDQGGKPFTGMGQIQFHNTAKPEFTTTGSLDADGSFILGTIVGNQKLPGAMEGEHKVTITGLSKDQSKPPTTYALKKKYVLKSGESDIIVALD